MVALGGRSIGRRLSAVIVRQAVVMSVRDSDLLCPFTVALGKTRKREPTLSYLHLSRQTSRRFRVAPFVRVLGL
jgi:hypothetical protein